MPRVRVPEEDTPQLYSHKDLRSRTKAHNRLRKQSQKYYGYRGVHPSWLGQTYLDCSISTRKRGQAAKEIEKHPFTPMFLLPQVHVVQAEFTTAEGPVHVPSQIYGRRCTLTTKPATWTRRDMYKEREDNIYPLDRQHHFSKRKYTRYGYLYDVKQRGQAMKQKHRNLEFEIGDNLDPANIGDRWEQTLQTVLDDYYFWAERDYELERELSLDGQLEPFTDGRGLTTWCTQSGFLQGQYRMDGDEPQEPFDSEFEDRFSEATSGTFLHDAFQYTQEEEEDFDMLSDVEFDIVSLSSISSNDY